jgi:hypothetical protein
MFSCERLRHTQSERSWPTVAYLSDYALLSEDCNTFCQERDVVDSMFEPFTKIVVHPACASAHGSQVVQVNFREFWVIKKLIRHGGNHSHLSDRMSDNNAVKNSSSRLMRALTGEGS